MTVTFPIPIKLEDVELHVIRATIQHFHGDKRAAADALGISLKTVYNKLKGEQPS